MATKDYRVARRRPTAPGAESMPPRRGVRDGKAFDRNRFVRTEGLRSHRRRLNPCTGATSDGDGWLHAAVLGMIDEVDRVTTFLPSCSYARQAGIIDSPGTGRAGTSASYLLKSRSMYPFGALVCGSETLGTTTIVFGPTASELSWMV